MKSSTAPQEDFTAWKARMEARNREFDRILEEETAAEVFFDLLKAQDDLEHRMTPRIVALCRARGIWLGTMFPEFHQEAPDDRSIPRGVDL